MAAALFEIVGMIKFLACAHALGATFAAFELARKRSRIGRLNRR